MKYYVKVLWKKQDDELFTDLRYSRQHKWIFDGGTEVAASSSPHVVPLPYSDESAVDPEEAFIASLSSCHMLFYLSIAAANKYTIEAYQDDAEGFMENNENGDMAMTVVTLRPKVTYSGEDIPSKEQIEKMHESAHKKCYISNSVKSKIKILSE